MHSNEIALILIRSALDRLLLFFVLLLRMKHMVVEWKKCVIL